MALGFVAERKAGAPVGRPAAARGVARALVNRPRCCCWTNRSARWISLREQMQGELKKLQRQLGITLSSSPTIKAKRCRCPIGSRCLNNGRIGTGGRRASFTSTEDAVRRRVRRHAPTWCAASWRSACSAKAGRSGRNAHPPAGARRRGAGRIRVRARCRKSITGARPRGMKSRLNGGGCWSAGQSAVDRREGSSGKIGQPIVPAGRARH